MKKKFNFKLTAFLVSLFVSLLLLVLGNKNAYCLSLGLILLGLSLGIYAYSKVQSINFAIKELEMELQEVDFENVYLIKTITKYQKKLKRQRNLTSVMFYSCAIVLMVLGFVNMI